MDRFTAIAAHAFRTPRTRSAKSKMCIVDVEQGSLKGVACENNEGKYVAFKGIPYAKPPIGYLRFKAPKPPEPWEGIRDASQHGPVCPQYNERIDKIEPGSEDCLYLNVYTKTINPSHPLPVVVWIHGGGYYTGSGNSDFYGPEFFMAHDVILVTFNYRLEVLGFLCLDNEEVPGNAGLKDQVAALRWIKKNIGAFGGDTNNITIFGCSAGAGSTSYHLLSKMSDGLFHKAICQSGVCLNEWAYGLYGRQRAFQLGQLLGKDTEDPMELLEFLRNVPVLSLVNIQLPFLNNEYKDLSDGIIFGPVIEKSDLKTEKFITQLPIELVRKGQVANVPIILGYTSGEGMEIARKLINLLDYMNTVGAVVPRELKYRWSPEKIQDADERIRKFYFKGDEISLNKLQEFIKLETDTFFLYNIHRFARYHCKNTACPVYFYKFTAETERNYTKRHYKMDAYQGVCHADDLYYQFHVTTPEVPLTDESREIIKQFVRLWTNFACTGNPTTLDDTEKWKPFTESQENCYIIGRELKCVQNEDAESIKFWKQLYSDEFL